VNGSVALTSSTANGLTFASAIAAVVPYSCDLIMDFEQLHSVDCRQASCIFPTTDEGGCSQASIVCSRRAQVHKVIR